MKTLILNGSPRAAQGNTEVFIRQFMRGAGQSCPVRYVAKEPASEIAQAVRGCGVLLVFLPLYVHAMPGIVLKVFEQMKPAAPGQKIGFVVQQGFAEAAQSQFLVRYLNAFAKRLGYKNLGVVVKGDAAATSMMPAFITRKLFKRLAALGRHYAQSGQWDKSIAAQLAGPYHLSAQAAKGNERLNRLGIGHIAWHKFWRNNHLSVEQGRGRPYSS